MSPEDYFGKIFDKNLQKTVLRVPPQGLILYKANFDDYNEKQKKAKLENDKKMLHIIDISQET